MAVPEPEVMTLHRLPTKSDGKLAKNVKEEKWESYFEKENREAKNEEGNTTTRDKKLFVRHRVLPSLIVKIKITCAP